MDIIGFITVVCMALYMSAGYLLYSVNTLGKYNIGGVTNSIGSKAFCFVLGCILSYGWYVILYFAPFKIIRG